MLIYPNGMWRHLLTALPFIERHHPRGRSLAVQAGLRTRHITSVAITTACRNATHSANLHAYRDTSPFDSNVIDDNQKIVS